MTQRRAGRAAEARRTLLIVLVLALAAGGLWWQRDRVLDGLDEVRDRINEQTTPSTSAPPASSTPITPAPAPAPPGG
jgi:hypothetical protein